MILKFLINIFDDKKFEEKRPKGKVELLEMIYLLTEGYPYNSLKDDSIVRRIVSKVTENISKSGVCLY